jgi:hypothetical protein
VLERLREIINNHVGVVDLAEDLDIETVTVIFIRVSLARTELSQADLAMSKLSVNEKYVGDQLKAIDYFCHISVAPEYFSKIEKTTNPLRSPSSCLRRAGSRMSTTTSTTQPTQIFCVSRLRLSFFAASCET